MYCGATYDFKAWLLSMREERPNVETGIQDAFVIELFLDTVDVSKRGVVFMRVKPRMGMKYKWSTPLQFYPHRDGIKRPMLGFNTKPLLANLKRWLQKVRCGDKIKADYIKFLDSDHVSAYI